MALFGGWRLTRTGILFFVGLVVLIALVVGAIWWVRERGEQVRREEAIQVAEETLTEQSNNPVAISPSEPEADEEESSQATPTSSELPATGPELSALLAVGMLAIVSSYYVASRRALARL
jgi:hypothetical protein